ncbi:HAD-IA family hydrolase [Mesorhizobium sp. LHD-90]|uniref:HAD-IA family hydrolase n=1 Tax=Mesorhizobium sp. LHD-90 TaxID=3071414 RepID=UPI0027E1FADF|nr:HAD-IA family hydrolase [Mesorhizobium sp. LHD-90]MDQ6435839.1 HAD-IA family hydrolase [Mesorhizobium sp. LHD-90]
MQPRLIIFDCDGVLVDSEPISMSVLLGVIAGAGGAVSEEAAYLRFLGMSMESVRDILSADFGFVVTEEHITIARSEMRRRYAEELKPMPGMKQAIGRLGLPCCVASSGTSERIRLSLATTGLLELLEPNIYSAAMVERGKPAPDLFLHAAREMGAPPAACIVVEDSPAGVAAAQAAGMRVFGFTGGSHAGKAGLRAKLAALEPDLIFDDMALLPDLVARSGSQARAV